MDATALTHAVEAAPASTGRRALRMTRRGRLLVTTVVVGVTLVLLAAAAGAFSGTPGSDQTPVVYRSVTVLPGQSLWEVAQSVAPDSDARATVSRIVQLNHLASPTDVRAGQQIAVPSAPQR